MSKLTLLVIFALSCYLITKAQSTEESLTFEHIDKCGKRGYESDFWLLVEGTVIKVVGGDSIILLTKDKKRKRIDLAAVNASTKDDDARRMLATLVLNKQVEAEVQPSEFESKRVSGVVHTPGTDVNRELIRAGVARYKEPKPYSMSHYTACVYRITEAEAREAKRGLWRNVSSR